MLALEIADAVRSGKSTPKEVLLEHLERVERVEPQLHAFITLNPQAEAEAQRVAERIARGEHLPLAGVPVALKDNICTRGLATSAGSRVLERFVPPYSATVVEKLRAAGAVVLGKANMDEFAQGSSTEYSAFGPTRNPWSLEHVPGGTSGGSAAAVGAGMVPLALGTDTGGSVRQPAGFCGIYGFKPTYGRISRYGVIATASSLDQVGTMARAVADLAALTDAVSGPDPMDSTSLEAQPRFTQALDPAEGPNLKVGVVREAFGGNTAGVDEACENFRKTLEGRGVRFIEVSIPSLEYALAAYYIVNTAEISSNLARYDGTLYGSRASGEDMLETMMLTREQGFGPEVKRRILMGTFALSSGYYDAYYGKALRARAKLKADFEVAFGQADLLLTPTSPFPAFKFGSKTADPLSMYLADIDTVAINLVGVPAMSIPAGFEEGLPVGVQLIGKPLHDEVIFRAALAFEQATDREFVRTASTGL
ncbi:MAG: Asp-tRNA(Asn)/Glu-tRNA(Gln) amidotransferase subunit GatA [Meiothermus sp.]|nr:Asp-tRNA(Asn)/Glu-tRNA(Gln) amidotransferase subunit GatA [Meiothermus sp.]